MDVIKEIQQYLASDLQLVNNKIISNLAVEEELIRVISCYLAESGGKRIRPIIMILSARLFGYKAEDNINLAAAIELIHMATLLHDDVVDGSKMRRFLPSANVVWGGKASILVGDFLFSQAFKMIVQTQSLDAMEVLSNASARIAEGEVSQLVKLEERKFLLESEYIQIIRAKTAELFAAACEVGAIIAGKSQELCDRMRVFGDNLGCIFQIKDDLLDYFSDNTKVGKNIGDDFMEGKITLPIIFLDNKLVLEEQQKLRNLIWSDKKSSEDFMWLKEQLCLHNIELDILFYLDGFYKAARNALDSIEGDNKCKEYLNSLLDFAMNRKY